MSPSDVRPFTLLKFVARAPKPTCPPETEQQLAALVRDLEVLARVDRDALTAVADIAHQIASMYRSSIA